MKSRQSPVKRPPGVGAETLSTDEMDRIWIAAVPYLGITASSIEYALLGEDAPASESIEYALSGEDAPASRSYLIWLEQYIRDRQPIPDNVREYALSALSRYAQGRGISLGMAFGLERPAKKRGEKPIRKGARRAIVELIRYLSEREKYSLGVPNHGPSAFDVAAQVLSHKWGLVRSPHTLAGIWREEK